MIKRFVNLNSLYVAMAVLLAIFITLSYKNGAENVESSNILADNTVLVLKGITSVLDSVLFYKIFDIPFIVLWLMAGGVFFTLRLGFINFRLFGHSIDVLRGKYSSGDEAGEVSHFQALSSAVSATVGLGNIAGVAIAVSVGGPGAVIWMVLAGLFGMSTKFAEVTLGQKYREIDENGKVSGGAFHYLRKGLEERGMPVAGKIIACVFAFCCIMGSFGIGSMFQSSQAVSTVTHSFGIFNGMEILISFLFAVSSGLVLIGGIKRIAVVAEAIVPFMVILYVASCIVVVAYNYSGIGNAFAVMFEGAFNGAAVGGGIIGAIIAGVRRAAFSNEAGLGSAPIAHATAKTHEPVREGCVALLEPFLDTVIICFMTGLVIVVTGVYQGNADGAIEGVTLTTRSFATVSEWFPALLSISVVLFAYSTMITWSYYGERCWSYLFNKKTVMIYNVAFCLSIFVGGAVGNISLIVDLSDLLTFTMAIPNLIGLYMLSGTIKKELDSYITKLRNKEFKTY